jgi:hypothetical protein
MSRFISKSIYCHEPEPAHSSDRGQVGASLARDLPYLGWSVDSRELCQPRMETDGKPLTESKVSLRFR